MERSLPAGGRSVQFLSVVRKRVGEVHAEQVVILLRAGWGRRVRFWMGLRCAYLVHVFYGRVWMDAIAQQLNLSVAPWRSYVRSRFLAQMFRRTRFPLFGGFMVHEALGEPPPI
jgi:hypothetical protein